MPFGLEIDRASLIEHAQHQLGYPRTCVELAPKNFEDAVDEMEFWMAAHMGFIRRTDLTLVAGVTQYALPSDCMKVTDVALPQQGWAFSMGGFGDAVPGLNDYLFNRFHVAGAKHGGAASSLYQAQQYTDMWKRVVGADVEATWEQYQRKLIVTPSRVSGKAIVWYLTSGISYEELDQQQMYLARRYVVAQAMLMLGRIRSKFSEIPVAGGTATLNGSDLVASAENEVAELNEKIVALSPPMPFSVG